MVGTLPITLQQAVSNYLVENSCLGQGDLRVAVTIEALQRTETQDEWVVGRRHLNRADVMELCLDMVAQGYSLPAILGLTGMPKPRTLMTWISDYKVFADLLEVAEKMRALVLAEQALEIVDNVTDPKQAFVAKNRADLRMRFAETLHSKKFGKKQQIDVTHHDDLSGPEVWSRFGSVLTVHADLIYEKTGIKVLIPVQDAEVVSVKFEEEEASRNAIGMQGEPASPEDWEEGLNLGEDA